MKAVILAGGLGTRLRPLSYILPKPMVPVFNRPLLQHTLTYLARYDITDILMLLYYMPETIRDYFGDGTQFGVSVEYYEAGEDYSTAGAVRMIHDRVDAPFLVVSGDVITDLDLTALVEFHAQTEGLATLALTRVADPTPFGIVSLQDDKRLTRFVEKPGLDQTFSDLINMGIYVLEPEMLNLIPLKQKVYFARDVFPDLIDRGYDLFGHIADCYWRDIGNITAYKQLHWDGFEGKVSLDFERQKNRDFITGDGCRIDGNVHFEGRVVIGDRCIVGDGVYLKDCVIGNECQIGAGASLRRTIMWHGEVVAGDTIVEDRVIATKYEQRVA